MDLITISLSLVNNTFTGISEREQIMTRNRTGEIRGYKKLYYVVSGRVIINFSSGICFQVEVID